MPHALIVDDDVDSLTALAVLVNREGFTTDTASTLREAREKMAQRRPDVVLLDLVLPDGNGMDLFQDIESRSVTEVVLITGHASLETSVEALRLGAADYLIKPVNVKQLQSILSRVARPADLKAEINKLRGDLRSLGHFGRLIGVSTAMQKVYNQIARVAPTPAQSAGRRRARDGIDSRGRSVGLTGGYPVGSHLTCRPGAPYAPSAGRFCD